VKAPLDVECRDGVAVVTLNRPEKRNALSLELRELFADRLAALAVDDAIACIVVTGAGSAFCSGMDTSEFGGDRAQRERIVELSVAFFRAIAAFPKPAIAAVNGPAIAGGFALALHCDVRIASEDARLGFAEPPGIPPSYAAARAALPAWLARDLCLTGRVVQPEEAAALGIVSEVVPGGALMPRVAEIAGRIARSPAPALATKQRILLERERYAPLFDEEERMLRDALLGGDS
jgi:3-hydroxypropionyl-coenzyme A dehydratase